MRVKLDENVPSSLAPIFRSAGHDVDDVHAEGIAGRSGDEVLSAAAGTRRMIVTIDRGFADPCRHELGVGIVVLRPRIQSVGVITDLVRQFLAAHDLDTLVGCIVVVHPMLVRIRRL